MKFENLISELCPNGVVYSPLGALCKIETGKLNANAMDENGIYPFFTCDAKPFRINTYAFNTEAILVSGNGSQVGHINYYNGKFNAYQRTYVLSDFNGIHVGFLLHYLQGYLREHIYVNSRKGSVPYITLPMLQNFRIPISPLPVQREIVRILDNFTELTAELTAELAARRKQYEHYRDELLTFGDEVPRIPLGEVGPVCMCKRILKSQTNDVGGVPFYKIGTFGKQANAYISKETYEEYRNKYNFPKKGDILISAAGTIGRTVVYDGEPAYFQDSNIVWVANDETKILNRFLIHCYAMKPWYVSTGGTIARLYNDNILKAVVPVPSLERQKFIVDTLDRFDTLCNDLTSGLPAEIAARQKQYEYYRDKLLTFGEKEN